MTRDGFECLRVAHKGKSVPFVPRACENESKPQEEKDLKAGHFLVPAKTENSEDK